MTTHNANAQKTVTFRRFGAADARKMASTVRAVYEASYADAIASGDPFDAPDAFMNRVDAYVKNPDLDLVIAYDSAGEPIGQTWGWPLQAGARWWHGIQGAPDNEFVQEDGARTFALSEIMVSQPYTGRGVAHALHDNLLNARPERRATLLVEHDNPLAYRAYLNWGWEHVAHLQPDWPSAPLFDVLILAPLPKGLVPEPQ